MQRTLTESVRALQAGRAVADLGEWRKLLVAGADARRFLGDLLTGEIAELAEGTAARSLLLTPTGRLRADVTVAAIPEGFLVVQDPAQPRPIGESLAPYVLSADVAIEDLTERRALIAVVGPATDPLPDGWSRYRPGALDAGEDVLLPVEDREAALERLGEGRERVGPEGLEAWRVLEGRPRFPVDVGEESLPQEAGLDHAIDFTKGCFLGQEAVAKIRNLGHPTHVVLRAWAEGAVGQGQPVREGDRDVGRVTSATADPAGGTALLARVRWDAREAALQTASGDALSAPRPASAGGS